jgi:2-(1,2-epoxy-1,2-dihydrophenyl)acetyl-CoA isomerase
MNLRIDRPTPAVLRILIDRPTARNAIDFATRSALIAAVAEATGDAGVRALVIGGVDGMFCAGGDLPSMVGLSHDAALERLRHGHELVTALWEFPKPMVAAVEAFAVGAGAGLALTADDVIIGRTAVMGFPFLRLGLVPDWGLMMALPRRAGWPVASRLIRDCATVKGDPAVTIGLADQAVADDEVMATAISLAEQRATLPPAAFARVKRTMRGGAEVALALSAEALAQADSLTSAEFAEGYAALREKRPARF